MSINSLNPALSAYLGTVQRPGPTGADAARSRVEQQGDVRSPASTTTRPGTASIAAPAQSSLAAAAPPGTDPELWSVLTSEERTFFAKVGTMGPLTYGRMLQTPNAPPTIRGGRLDVKG